MAFTVAPTSLDAGTLGPGDTVDLAVAFTDVPPDVTGTSNVTIHLGAVHVDVLVNATADNPEPVVGSITVPQALVDQGISVSVPAIDATGATIRVSRA